MTFWEKKNEFLRRHPWFHSVVRSLDAVIQFFGGAYLGVVVALHVLGLC